MDTAPPDRGDQLTRRLGRDPLRFDCPMCSRVQKIRLADARCESCGSRFLIFDDPEEARRGLEAAEGRTRHLRDLGSGLYVVAVL